MNRDESCVHFGIAGILVSLSVGLGVPYLMAGLAVPRLPANPFLPALFAGAALSIITSMVKSIRMIGRGDSIGWGLLLGNCFYAVVMMPVATIHVGLALEMAG
jgi:hypothetical protein